SDLFLLILLLLVRGSGHAHRKGWYVPGELFYNVSGAKGVSATFGEEQPVGEFLHVASPAAVFELKSCWSPQCGVLVCPCCTPNRRAVWILSFNHSFVIKTCRQSGASLVFVMIIDRVAFENLLILGRCVSFCYAEMNVFDQRGTRIDVDLDDTASIVSATCCRFRRGLLRKGWYCRLIQEGKRDS